MNEKSKAGTLSESKLLDMLRMQAEMNAIVNPKWLTAHYPWLLAAMVEGVEAIGHTSWKWWKKEELNLEQLRMELVDIWHFALSDALVSCEGELSGDELGATWWVMFDLEDEGCNHISFDGDPYWLLDMDTVSRLRLLGGLAAVNRFDTRLFETLIEDVGMTWDDLYRSYVGKNVLNRFRQDHGYKQGTYQKIWDGREDNEHLTELLGVLDSEQPGFADALYMDLAYRYSSLVVKDGEQ